MHLSRRRFTQWAASVAAAACSRRSLAFAAPGLRLGLNTYSLRNLTSDEAIPLILQVMRETKLEECQLLGSHFEPAKFYPVLPPLAPGATRSPLTPEQLEERRLANLALLEWRLATPMSFFENVRSTFEKQGLRITSVNVRLAATPADLDRQFQIVKALGATSINSRLPEPATSLVAAAAQRNSLTVGIQVVDIAVAQKQIATSTFLRMDPDIGDLTKAGENAQQFVEANYQSITSLDLKDATPHGPSVPFGQGDSHMPAIVRFLQSKHPALVAYIDCDYPGTGRSLEEVAKCTTFVQKSLA